MKKSTKIIIAGIAGGGLIALAWFLLRPVPDLVLLKAQRNLIRTTSLHYEIDVKAEGEWPFLKDAISSDDEVDFTGSLQTDLNRINPLQPASVSKFDLRDGGEQSTRISGEGRKKASYHYLKLERAEGVSDEIAQKIMGRWVRHYRPFYELIYPPSEKQLTERPYDAAGYEKMKAAFESLSIFRYLETLSSEKIDGVPTYHYRVEPDEQVVIALMLKRGELLTGVQPVTADHDELVRRLGLLGELDVEVWIGKKDVRIRKIRITAEAPDGSTASLTAFFSRYDQVVKVEAPESEDLKKLLGPTLTGRLTLAGLRAFEPKSDDEEETPDKLPVATIGPDEDQDSDGDALPDLQEYFYGADAWNPDTDGDGYTDGQEVGSGMNPVGPGVLFGFGL